MEYINFNVALPYCVYLRLEENAKKMNLSKNEIIVRQILSWKAFRGLDLKVLKNAGFENRYNKN